jgi:phage gp29-like protein
VAGFAEKDPFTPEQQELEQLADTLIADAAEAFTANEAAILSAVEGAGSYADAIATLLELYPRLDVGRLEDALQRALLNTELFGRYTAKQEALS